MRFLLGLLPLLALPTLAYGQNTPRKYAFLVGIDVYEHPNLPTLRYAEWDVFELKEVLQAGGYDVTLLSGTRGRQFPAAAPTKVNIDQALRRVLERARPTDTVLVALAGHGLEMEKAKASDVDDAYFCPVDARPFANRRDTMVSLRAVYQELEQSFAGVKILMVDACRAEMKLTVLEKPNAKKRNGITADNAPSPPKGVAAFFSSSGGEFAFETPALKHGVFYYYVLEGLRGRAKNVDGEVTFNSLVDYVSRRVPTKVVELAREENYANWANVKQNPNWRGNLSGPAPVLLRPGEEKAKQISNSIGMKVVYIREGKFTMGSPDSEQQECLREFDRGWVTQEVQHEVTIAKAFYLGKYAVTQEEYETIMGKNPSHFSENGGGSKVVAGLDTRRFPVESITWAEANEFCRKLSLKEGKTYRLPTEAEWEYACRAGTKTTFHFGETMSTDQANYNGEFPFKNGLKGVNRGHPMPVGSFPANAWGLHDMHGNVYQWCSDWHDRNEYSTRVKSIDPKGPAKGEADPPERVIRGGAWFRRAAECRSAFRHCTPAGDRGNGLGFRIVLQVDP